MNLTNNPTYARLNSFTIMTLLRNGISLQTGRNHQSNRCQRRQIEKIRNTTAVSFFFLFSEPALLAVRGTPPTARSFDRSKNARKRKRLLAVYFKHECSSSSLSFIIIILLKFKFNTFLNLHNPQIASLIEAGCVTYNVQRKYTE